MLQSSKNSSERGNVTLDLVYLPIGSRKEGEEKVEEFYYGQSFIHSSHFEHSHDNAKSSLEACTVTMANTIMGAATLGLPFAVSNTGYVLGSVLLCVSGLASSFALHCLSLCALKL
eukprot:gene49437-60522_t